MLSIAKIVGESYVEDDSVKVDGSTVTLRRPRTTLTKQYKFDAVCGDSHQAFPRRITTSPHTSSPRRSTSASR